MTKQKTISSLSIAAIALVAAAVPALAQGQTESSDKNASMNGATPVVEQTIASNLESLAVRKSRVVTSEVEPASSSSKPLVLSALKGQNNSRSAASTQPVTFTRVAPIDPMAKEQFRADETEINRTKHVAFLASRGQKLPE